MILAVECKNLSFILNIVAYLFKIIQWVIPILLIVLITIDMAKVMIAGDEKATKEASSKAVKRLIYAIVLFLVPILVRMVFNMLASRNIGGFGGETSATSWISCWRDALNNV